MIDAQIIMNIRNISVAVLVAITAALSTSLVTASEKPVQHLELPDVRSLEEAKQVFSETTSELRSKKTFDVQALNDIHIITYSLEKALAYFVENMPGDSQAAAEEMAEIVEQIHLGSENNRVEETKQNLAEYFKLAEAFSLDF